MAKKSKLLAALDAHKGRDYQAEKQKKLQKQAAKRKSEKPEGQEDALERPDILVRGANGIQELSEESEGWESDESEEFDGLVLLHTRDKMCAFMLTIDCSLTLQG